MCTISGTKMAHLSWIKIFGTNHWYYFHLPIGPFHCGEFKRNSSRWSRVMRMVNFWAQNGSFPQIRFFSENLLTSFVSFFHAYLHAKVRYQSISEILMIKEYWNLIGRESLVSLTWDLDFSQVCSFSRMLMNHKRFDFTQIPGKYNDEIFLTIFSWWRFFPKNPGLSRNYIWTPNIILSFREN